MPRTRNRIPARKPPAAEKWLVPGILITFILVMAAGLFYAFSLSQATHVPLDQVTLCRTDKAPDSITVILLDLTDALTLEEKTQIGYEFSRIQRTVPQHGLLEVYFLHRDINETREPVFRACNPGDGSDMNRLYQNPELARQRWETGFVERLDHAFETSYGLDSSDRSLIFEAIRLIAINRFGPPEHDGAKKHLILISDLLQHNPGVYTQYRSAIESYSVFSSTDYFYRTRSDLRNVSVQIIYHVRPATRRFQGRAHIEFWMTYLENSGAELQGVKRLLGD